MQKTVTYFEKTGPENTKDCLEIVRNSIDEFNYKHVIVASTTGSTGELFAESLKDKGVKIAAIARATGLSRPTIYSVLGSAAKRS